MRKITIKTLKIISKILEKTPLVGEIVFIFLLFIDKGIENKIMWGFAAIFCQIESFYMEWVKDNITKERIDEALK